jgi:hypothetical protein
MGGAFGLARAKDWVIMVYRQVKERRDTENYCPDIQSSRCL